MRTDVEQDRAAREPRFEFGKNWLGFLSTLDLERIAQAERSLSEMLRMETLAGRTFLDVGSGSGLSSLVAMRMGAKHVRSFDYDPQSVACTRELKRRYFPDAENWIIETGSALDREYLQSLGQWDVVYSWGVLHHTGSMWDALENAARLVGERGTLFISIYNDQGTASNRWRRVKLLYNRSTLSKWLVVAVFVPYFAIRGLAGDVLRGKNPTLRYREHKMNRGMSVLHDWLDWLGGYPFEVAKPGVILEFLRARGFVLERLQTCGGSLGCNEFVFRRAG